MSLSRYFYLAVFLACLSLLGFGLYLEHSKGLEPCPLCVFQRIAYIAVMLIALVAAIHDPRKWGRNIYFGLTFIAAAIGAGIAGRQTWLQHLPADEVPACGPGLDYMLEVFPLADALEMILTGSGECAEVQWTFIGLSIPEWSLICFSLILIASIIVLIKSRQERQLFR
ncbi:MAG: disulfide bond formation protein B [Pseudomonadota bacterium]